MAKYYHKNNSKDTSGTPGYMAPEVMWSKNHTKAVDYFALGIIGYECMKGERPYLGSRKDIKEKILSKQVQITKNDIVLEDWKTIKWNTIENVDMQNDEFISSKMFATQSC